MIIRAARTSRVNVCGALRQ